MPFRRDAGINPCAGHNAFHFFQRHQEQSLAVKTDHFALDFLNFTAVVTFDQAGGTDRQLQPGGFQHQPGCARQAAVTTNLRRVRDAFFQRIE
ncbi:hypothetical protein D3C78_1183270 [compost metagenome]